MYVSTALRRTHWSPGLVLEVLTLINDGAGNAQIAQETGVSIPAIRNYRAGRVPARALKAMTPERYRRASP